MPSILVAALQGSIEAILKLVAVLTAGALSAHFGFLTAITIPLLSSFTFVWISATQVISNLGREFAIPKLALYWPLLVWGTYTILLGYLVGWIYCRLFKPPREFETSIVSCTAYANTIGLPIVIFDSLSVSLFTTATQTALEAYQRAVAYTFVYSVPWNLLMFIFGYPYVLELKANTTSSQANNNVDQPIVDNITNNSDNNLDKDVNSKDNNYQTDINQLGLNEDPSFIEERYYSSITTAKTSLHCFDIDIEDDPNYPPAPFIKACGIATKQYNRGCDFITYWFNKLFFSHLPNTAQFTMVMIFTNPPTVATLFSLFIGVVPPLKDPLYNTDGTFHFLIKAVDFVALAAAPLSNLVTAANIYHSVHRNFGPKARELRRIIDLVNEAQQLDETDPIIITPGEDTQESSQQSIITTTTNVLNQESFNDTQDYFLVKANNSDPYTQNQQHSDPFALDEEIVFKPQPLFGSNDNSNESTSIIGEDDLFGDELISPQPISLISKTINPAQQSSTPKLRPKVQQSGIAGSQSGALIPSKSHLRSNLIPPLDITTSRLQAQQAPPLLPLMNPTILMPMGPTRARSPSSTSIISHQSNFSLHNQSQNSDYLIPLHATGGSMLRDASDLQMLNRTHSHYPKQSTASLSVSRQQYYEHQIISPNPITNNVNNNNNITNHAHTLLNDISTNNLPKGGMYTLDKNRPNNNQQQTPSPHQQKGETQQLLQPTQMNRVDYIMSHVDPSIPIEYDPETGHILPLPRLSWAHMFGIAIARLIIVPLMVWLTMLFVIAVGWEESLLPTAAGVIFRTYIILAACSVPADSILMIITKSGRVRQSMAMSLAYVVQYIICVVTIPSWLVLINVTNSHLDP